MPGLVPGIHVFAAASCVKTRMTGTSSAKASFALLPGHDVEMPCAKMLVHKQIV
jgi:hypothetical protein